MAIKKSMQEIYDILDANQTATVASVMSQLESVMSTKARGAAKGESVRTSLRDADDNVVAIRCYYFKRWMPLVGDEAVDFGAKAGTNTGLNSMCKEGVSHWTKQQRVAKEATANILVDVEAGTLDASDIAAAREEIEAARQEIADTTLGFESLAEVQAYLEDNGVTLAE